MEGFAKYFFSDRKILKNTTECVRFLSSQEDLDFVQYTKHSKYRKRKRKITNKQILFIIQKGAAIGLQKSTREGFCKVRILGKDFDEKEITVVVIPGDDGIKLITAFYTKKYER